MFACVCGSCAVFSGVGNLVLKLALFLVRLDDVDMFCTLLLTANSCSFPAMLLVSLLLIL